jgi:hypothetical protein
MILKHLELDEAVITIRVDNLRDAARIATTIEPDLVIASADAVRALPSTENCAVHDANCVVANDLISLSIAIDRLRRRTLSAERRNQGEGSKIR